MDPLVVELVASAVRWLMAVVGGYLVAKHVINADQADRLTSDIVNHALLALPIVVSLLWSAYAKYRGRLKFIAAVEAPAGTSETEINAAASTAVVKAQAFTGTL